MICPTLVNAVIITKGMAEFSEDTAKGLTQCGDWCAWFDKKKGQCAILTLAQSSYSLKETIQTLSQTISIK